MRSEWRDQPASQSQAGKLSVTWPPAPALPGSQLSVTRMMAERVLETDFPLIAPPNPPLSVHPRIVRLDETGRNGSLRRAYSCVPEITEATPLQEITEATPLQAPAPAARGGGSERGSETSDYLSDSCAGPPGYTTLPQKDKKYATNSLTHTSFRPPTHRYSSAQHV